MPCWRRPFLAPVRLLPKCWLDTPVTLAGMLYLGSGLGLLACFVVRAVLTRNSNDKPATLTATDLPWLAGAIAFGGIAGPVLLMFGLTLTPAS